MILQIKYCEKCQKHYDFDKCPNCIRKMIKIVQEREGKK